MAATKSKTRTRRDTGQRTPVPTLVEQRPSVDTPGRTVTAVTEAGCQVVKQVLSAGGGLDSAATALGMARVTLTDCARRQADLRQAIQAGNAALEERLVGSLLKQALDGFAPAAMFLLKTRFRYRETGPPDGGDERSVSVNINIPAPMTDADFRRLIDGTSVERAQDDPEGRQSGRTPNQGATR